MNKEFNIQLLVSYLTGNCSDIERNQLEEWLAESEENKATLEEYKAVWNSSGINDNACLINLDRAWNEFKDRSRFDEQDFIIKPRIMPAVAKSRSLVYRIASAAALILIVLGLVFVLNSEKETQMINFTSNASSSQSPIILPDGTNITFNKQSGVTYPEEFASDFRRLNFHGEAFFNVHSNAAKPMIIASDNIRVKVLGTSFNLKNTDDSNEITVHLEEGKVLFYSVDDNDNIIEQIKLLPGEVGIYNKVSGSVTKDVFVNQNYKAWETGVLDFINAPLSDVLNTLKKTYDLEIDSQVDLSKYFLTAHYEGENPENIFHSLELIYGLKIKIQENQISIN
jgi:ferric-dicitrate binding protein FerR (iron transport regulator)